MHAIVQAWQPTHLRVSITIVQRRSSTGFAIARRRSACIRIRGSTSPSSGTVVGSGNWRAVAGPVASCFRGAIRAVVTDASAAPRTRSLRLRRWPEPSLRRVASSGMADLLSRPLQGSERRLDDRWANASPARLWRTRASSTGAESLWMVAVAPRGRPVPCGPRPVVIARAEGHTPVVHRAWPLIPLRSSGSGRRAPHSSSMASAAVPGTDVTPAAAGRTSAREGASRTRRGRA